LGTQSGDPVWVIRDHDHKWPFLGGSGTPVIYNDLLIMHLYNNIVAFNMNKRDAEWWLPTPTTALSTPVIKDDILYLNTWVQGGEEKDRGNLPPFKELIEMCDKNNNQRIEKEEFREDMIWYGRTEIMDRYSTYYLKDNSFFNRFDTDKDGAIVENEWEHMLDFSYSFFRDHGMLALPLKGSGERTVIDIKWKINKDTPETPSPLVVGENVFFIKDGGIFTVITRESGEEIHKERINGAAGPYLSSPLLAGNRIYTCSYNGIVTVISAEDFSILAQNILKEKIGASPVAINDVLYVRTDKHLYAFR
jgi:outer membrane protein assembly factor BamB